MDLIRHDCMPYPDSVAEQERLVADVLAGRRRGCLVLTEHPPVYTIGTSGSPEHVLTRTIGHQQIDVFHTGRGGEVTYHGPGQLVCYVIADLRDERDLHRHVWRLEEMIIRTLSDFGISAERDTRGIGVWVRGLKIAAVGVRCRRWVTYHGIALNIDPDMRHFEGIVTCGMSDRPVTSMAQQGVRVEREAVERRVLAHARTLFFSGASSLPQASMRKDSEELG